MSIAFRDLPVYDLTGATRNFEQLVVTIGSLEEKVKTLEERKNFKPTTPGALAVRETNKELEASATKDTAVVGFVWFKAEAGTVHFKVNKVEVTTANESTEQIVPFAFVVPAAQKWEGTLEGGIKELKASYTFLD